MKFTGSIKYLYSDICGEEVSVMEYKANSKVSYCNCSRCGKPIKNKMYVIQSRETFVELMYLGSSCIKSFT